MLLKIAATAALLATVLPHDPLPDLAIGTALPAADVKMKDVVGGERSLKDIAGENGVLVIFSCNTCPFVIGSEGSEGWQGRYPALGEQCRKNKIGFVLVNSNEAKRDAGDSYVDMQAQYKQQNYNGHYVLDKGHVVADAFGARTTPHVFLFDKGMKLVYKGAIDDNVESAGAVQKHYLDDAITAMLAGKAADPATTRNMGCSIKRMEHQH
ncbi:MAG: thioredoxin family protein [Bacteroidetes bacterium]|nr:thioredoxin family protein [Bacteroidota bacterium]